MKKNCFFVLVFASLLLFFFSSCASVKEEVRLNKVYVTNTTPVPLLAPSSIKTQIEQMQYFEGNFGKNSFSSMLYLQADSNEIQILMLNEMGIEIGSLFYDGKTCTMESSFFPKNLKAEYIILDLQNAYADVQELKAHYKKYGLDFAQTGNDRTLSKKGTLIEQITQQGSTVIIENTLRGYTYRLTSGEKQSTL